MICIYIYINAGTSSVAPGRPLELLVLPFWLVFSHGPKGYPVSSKSFGQVSFPSRLFVLCAQDLQEKLRAAKSEVAKFKTAKDLPRKTFSEAPARIGDSRGRLRDFAETRASAGLRGSEGVRKIWRVSRGTMTLLENRPMSMSCSTCCGIALLQESRLA